MLKNFSLLGVGLSKNSGEVGNLFPLLRLTGVLSQYISLLYKVYFMNMLFSALVNSQVCITDPDLIEKSNLNRQFLFRPHHIQVNRRPLPEHNVLLPPHFLFLSLSSHCNKFT